VDGILIIFHHNKITEDTISNIINSVDEQEHEFKMLQAENKNINYLDLSMYRNTNNMDLNVYRKPTYIDITIHLSSSRPYEHKLASFI
jgi:hypothetical protein